MKLVAKGPINNMSALMQVMDWCGIDDYLNQWWPQTVTTYGMHC